MVEMLFDILNRLGVAHECDRQTDGRIEPPLEIAPFNDGRQNLANPIPNLNSKLLSLTCSWSSRNVGGGRTGKNVRIASQQQ